MAPKKSSEPFVLTRGHTTGVMCGYLVDRTADTITLREARQVWRWRGAETLTGLSQRGASLEEYTRIDQPAALVQLSTSDVKAVIHCSAEAEANLRQSRWLK